MSANRTYGDELADVFASFAVEKNPTGLSVGIDSAYELGEPTDARWIDEIETKALAQVASNARMVEIGEGVGGLGVRHPRMFEDLLAWQDASENDHADTVLRLIAALRAAGVTAVQGGQVVPCARCGENLVVAADALNSDLIALAREEQQKRAEAEAVIARIEQLCAETDVDTTEATQAWLVENIGAVLASYKTTNDENGGE